MPLKSVGGDGNQMGDEARLELERLHDAHLVFVYHFLRRNLGRVEDAEDATIETFRRAFQGLRSFRGECSERVWILRIASRVAHRCRERRHAHPASSLEALLEHPERTWEPGGSDPGHEQVLDRDLIERLLALLPADQRVAVWLRVAKGHTDEEVARILGVPVGTVKSWVWRSLARMRRATREAQAIEVSVR